MIAVGDRLPGAVLLMKDAEGIHDVDLGERLGGRRVVLFAVPGAFTPTCDSAHLPSFVRTAPEFAARGVDEIICVSVNDVHVMALWGQQSGTEAAGITMLADADAAFTKALGLVYSNPAAGMYDRSRRYAMLVEDGVVRALHLDEIGQCAISTGEAMLEELA